MKKYTRQILLDLKEDRDSDTAVVGKLLLIFSDTQTVRTEKPTKQLQSQIAPLAKWPYRHLQNIPTAA